MPDRYLRTRTRDSRNSFHFVVVDAGGGAHGDGRRTMSSVSAPTLLPFGRLAPGALSGSATRARQATGTHLHRIDGYSLVDGTMATGKAIRSSRFLVGGHHWELLYYPNGVNYAHRGFVSVDLALVGSSTGDEEEATASYRVTVLDYAGNPVHGRIVGPCTFDRGGSRWTGIEELVATEELIKTAPFLIKDDRLNVRCDVAVLKMETRPRNKWFMQLDRAINGFR